MRRPARLRQPQEGRRDGRDPRRGRGRARRGADARGFPRARLARGDGGDASSKTRGSRPWPGRRAPGLPTIGEDSGLAVDALGGAPGIFSARYAEGDDRARCEKLLRELAGVPPGRRTARYVCAAVLALPDGREESAQGTVRGRDRPGAAGRGRLRLRPGLPAPRRADDGRADAGAEGRDQPPRPGAAALAPVVRELLGE